MEVICKPNEEKIEDFRKEIRKHLDERNAERNAYLIGEALMKWEGLRGLREDILRLYHEPSLARLTDQMDFDLHWLFLEHMIEAYIRKDPECFFQVLQVGGTLKKFVQKMEPLDPTILSRFDKVLAYDPRTFTEKSDILPWLADLTVALLQLRYYDLLRIGITRNISQQNPEGEAFVRKLFRFFDMTAEQSWNRMGWGQPLFLKFVDVMNEKRFHDIRAYILEEKGVIKREDVREFVRDMEYLVGRANE